MNRNKTIDRAMALYWGGLSVLVSTAFAAMLIVMFIQVLSRYLFGHGAPWTDEASRYLFLASIFLGAVLAFRAGEHIAIPLVTDMLPSHIRNIVAVVADILSIVVLGMLLAGGWRMTEKTAGVMASTFQLSFSVVYIMQMISVGLMILYIAADVVLRLRGKVRDEAHESGVGL